MTNEQKMLSFVVRGIVTSLPADLQRRNKKPAPNFRLGQV